LRVILLLALPLTVRGGGRINWLVTVPALPAGAAASFFAAPVGPAAISSPAASFRAAAAGRAAAAVLISVTTSVT
jgi:hypothetical protein